MFFSPNTLTVRIWKYYVSSNLQAWLDPFLTPQSLRKYVNLVDFSKLSCKWGQVIDQCFWFSLLKFLMWLRTFTQYNFCCASFSFQVFSFIQKLFSSTVTNSKNVGVLYVRHEDTDPELEKQKVRKGSVDNDMKSTEESSEDEWTYKNVAGNHSMETELSENEVTADVQMSNDSSKELRNLSKMVLTDVELEPYSIQKLVDQAYELVQSRKKSATRRKYPSYASGSVRHDLQVLEWLLNTRPNNDSNSVSFIFNVSNTL